MTANDETVQSIGQELDRRVSEDNGRRQFLKNSALLSVAVAMGPLLGSGSALAQDKNIKPNGDTTMKQRKLGTMQVSEIGAG